MDDVVLELDAASFRYPRAPSLAVSTVSLAVRPGELVGVVGPNGSGKTTAMRLLTGTMTVTAGVARVGGRAVAAWPRRDLARVVGVVSQREEPAFPLTVEQAVLLGRYPHLGPLEAPSRKDREIVTGAMRRCDVEQFRDRWIATLSGGEWQRVRIARALAQQPRALILDEATANLDVRHEMEVFELVAALVRDDGLAGLVVTHHVNLAARFVDRLLVMDRGRTRAVGPPTAVLTKAVLEDVFAWPVDVTTWNGIPQFVPKRRNDGPPEPTQP